MKICRSYNDTGSSGCNEAGKQVILSGSTLSIGACNNNFNNEFFLKMLWLTFIIQQICCNAGSGSLVSDIAAISGRVAYGIRLIAKRQLLIFAALFKISEYV